MIAANELLAVVADFEFLDDNARNVWLALVLTMAARPAIRGCCPLFAFDASARGSGKSLLVEAASLLVRGRQAPTFTWTESSEEQRKLVISLLLGGESLLLIDNVKDGRELGGAALEAVLTTTEYSDRSLGTNGIVRAPATAVWAATGNNQARKMTRAARKRRGRSESIQDFRFG